MYTFTLPIPSVHHPSSCLESPPPCPWSGHSWSSFSFLLNVTLTRLSHHRVSWQIVYHYFATGSKGSGNGLTGEEAGKERKPTQGCVLSWLLPWATGVQSRSTGKDTLWCPRWGRGKCLPTGCSTPQSWWGALHLFISLYLNYLHKQNGWEVSLQRLWCADPVGAMMARTKRMGGKDVRGSISYMTSLSCKDIWEM